MIRSWPASGVPAGTFQDVTGRVGWATVGQDPSAPHFSPDGHWWWDGMAWRPVAPTAPSQGMSTGAIVALIAGVAIFVLVVVSVLSYVAFTRIDASLRSGNNSPANAIPCDLLEHTRVHYHAALQILDGGTPIAVPTALGRTDRCSYWLHLHAGEPGVIHIEAPNDRVFTLGDFFGVWSMWAGAKELIDAKHVSTISLSSDQKLFVYVDSGDGPQAYAGDPGAVVLKEHEVITLEIAPPTVNPPPAFDWPLGF